MDKKYYNYKKFKFTIIKDDLKKIKDIDKFDINVHDVHKCLFDHSQ